jgi:tRNA pseudouridine55 synthase
MMNGLLLLNKSLGHSSNRAMQQVKRLFGLKKIGHTGSLDPLASGMLPLCFGEATKFAQYLLDADKSYEVTGLLGIQTTTGDIEGDIVQESEVPSLDLAQLEEILNQFRGRIMQTPPMYSALKHQGQPLYRYALQGIDIERAAREVDINHLELLSFNSPYFTIRVSSSKGTYMRTLIEDIGQVIGCGAHVVKLHRLSTAGFQSHEMVSYEELEQMTEQQRVQKVLPMDVMVANFPKLSLDKAASLRLMQGQVLNEMALSPQTYRVYNEKDEFFGLADFLAGKGLVAKRLCLHVLEKD